MAANLPGDVCVGQHSVCLIRVAQLLANCKPKGGTDSGFVTAGIVTATASPVLTDGTTYEPLNGCGDIAWTYEVPQKIKAYTVSGELTFFDHELMSMLFGGSLIVGHSTLSKFPTDNIGWAAPNYTAAAPNPVYLEFITKTAMAGTGECSPTAGIMPYAVGHIFGKGRYVPGDRTFAAEAATMSFTGTSVANPQLGDGPWNDFPGVGGAPVSPYMQVTYAQTEFDAMAATAATCGFKTLPVNT